LWHLSFNTQGASTSVVGVLSTNNGYAQVLLKDSTLEPEAVLGNKITEQLWNRLDPKKATNCYHQYFFVKFKINDKGEVNEIYISANMKDETIISIVHNVIKSNENLWDIENCKKYNPSLSFLLPIDLNIFKLSCAIKYSNDNIVKSRYDFAAMLKYAPIEQNQVECIFCPTKEKFVGLVLNPIFVNNGKF
jgi:hypothetical protein